MSRRELGYRLDRLCQEAGKEVYHLLRTHLLGRSGSGTPKSGALSWVPNIGQGEELETGGAC